MKSKNITLEYLGKIFVKNIIIIVLLAFLGGLSFFMIARHRTNITYSAERDIMIRTNLNSDKAYTRLKTELDMIPTYRDMITSRQVMVDAKKELPNKLNKRTSLEDISNAVNTNSNPRSLIISVRATTKNKNDSIEYVNSVTKVAKKELPKLQPGVGDVYLYPKANSKNTTMEVHSSTKKYTLIGVSLGIIAGMVIAFTITSLKELN